MFKDNIKLIASVFVLLAIGVLMFWYSSKDTFDQQATQSIQENMQSSVEASRMQASRVQRGVYLIDREEFEKEVIDGLKTTKGGGFTNLKDADIKFAYLIDSEGSKLNDKLTDNKGIKVTADVTNPGSKYISVKGIRVLIDGNKDGVFTSSKDVVGTLALDTRSEEVDGEK